MLKRILCFAMVGIFISSTVAMAGESEKINAALTAAKKWLAIVDGGKYSDSWKESSEYFRQAVSQEQWEQAVQGVRKPLGKVLSRKKMSATYTTSLPGAPDGEYVVIQFATSFANKKSGVETITPMMDKDGVWRVSGYYIK